MFTDNIYIDSCIWTAHAITILLLAIYLYKSLQSPAKTYTTTIILIFNFLCILYPIAVLFLFWLQHEFIIFFISIIYHLTIYWATALAIFTYGVLNASVPFPFRPFMIKSVVLCLTFSIFSFYAIDKRYSEKSYIALLLDLIITVVPVVLISINYAKAYQLILSGTLGKSVYTNTSASKILWYSRITLICHSPKIITDILLILDLMRGEDGDGLSKFFVGYELKKIFYSIWAVLNLWVDWSVMRVYRERAITRVSLDGERSMSWLVDQENEQSETL